MAALLGMAWPLLRDAVRPLRPEILALANRPTYNPNNFRKIPREALKTRAVSDIYEPGSTFKILTTGIALQDLAPAALAVQRAREQGLAIEVEF